MPCAMACPAQRLVTATIEQAHNAPHEVCHVLMFIRFAAPGRAIAYRHVCMSEQQWEQ